MITLAELGKKLKEFCDVIKLVMRFLVHPENITNKTFASSSAKKEIYQNKYVLLFLVLQIFFISALKKLSVTPQSFPYLRSVVVILINLLVSFPDVDIITKTSPIKKEYQFYYGAYLFSVLSVLLFIVLLSFIIFLKTELYFFYWAFYITGAFRFIWLCLYVPIRTHNQSRIKKILKATFVILVYLISNTLASLLLLLAISKFGLLKYDFILVNDPVFTEVYNETRIVHEYEEKLLKTLLLMTEYANKDSMGNSEIKELVIQKCNMILSEEDSFTERYNTLKFRRTRKLYQAPQQLFKNIKQIRNLLESLEVLDIDELKNELEELNKLLQTESERNSLLEDKKIEIENNSKKLSVYQLELAKLEKEYKEFPEEKSSPEYQKIEKELDEIKNNLISMAETTLQYNKESLEVKTNIESLQKRVLNLNYRIQKLQNNVFIIDEITSLIKQSTKLIQNQELQLKANLHYFEVRLKYLYL